MKKSALALTACAFCAIFLAFLFSTFGVQAATTEPDVKTDGAVVVRPGDPAVTRSVKPPAETTIVIPADSEQRKNEANLKAAVQRCSAIVDKDTKTKCLNEAEPVYIDPN